MFCKVKFISHNGLVQILETFVKFQRSECKLPVSNEMVYNPSLKTFMLMIKNQNIQAYESSRN